MKFASVSDIHFTHKRPRNRKDFYFTNALLKFRNILDLCVKHKVDFLTISGDLFDEPELPYEVVVTILALIREYKVKIFAVVGQHDLRYHKSGINNTPLGVLVAAGVIELLSNKKVTKIGDVTLIGSGWEEEPKKEADIMLTHRMVTKINPLWPGQTEYITGKGLLKRYRWAKCIISGDNHKPHSVSFKGRVNINCGSMMRSSKRQIGHEPLIWFVDTKGWVISKTKLIITPAEDVFDFDKIEREETIKAAREQAVLDAEGDIKKFIDSMPSEERKKPKFRTILKSVVKQSKAKKSIVSLVNEIMEKVS